MRLLRGSVVLVLLLVLSGGLPAGGRQETKEFRYELAVERVVLDVVVHNAEGRFVGGLGRDDFEVFEEGKRVKIQDFELRSLVASDAEVSQLLGVAVSDAGGLPAAAREGRKFIVFVDLLNTGIGAINVLKPALRRFVGEQLHPQDEVLVSVLAANRKGLVLQSFTSSRPPLLRAIDSLAGNGDADNRGQRWQREIYTMLFHDRKNVVTRGQGSTLLAQMFNEIRRASGVARDASIDEFSRTSFALDAVASLVEWVDQSGLETGRKPVLYFSEGVPLQPGLPLYAIINRRIDEYNERQRSVPDAGQNTTLFHESVEADLRPVLRTTAGRLNRFGATLYGFDVHDSFQDAEDDASMRGRTRAGNDRQRSYLEGTQALGVLAADTGGLAYAGQRDLDGALEDAERDNRLRYFLTYAPPKHKKKKAKFYQIEIRCKRPGLTVRARKGYLD